MDQPTHQRQYPPASTTIWLTLYRISEPQPADYKQLNYGVFSPMRLFPGGTLV